MAGFCENAEEPSGFLKCLNFFDYLRTRQLLKKESAPRMLFVDIFGKIV